MARLNVRVVRKLTDAERKALLELAATGDRLERARASAVLMSAGGNSVHDIAATGLITAAHVYKWLDVFEDQGVNGLRGHPKGGWGRDNERSGQHNVKPGECGSNELVRQLQSDAVDFIYATIQAQVDGDAGQWLLLRDAMFDEATANGWAGKWLAGQDARPYSNTDIAVEYMMHLIVYGIRY